MGDVLDLDAVSVVRDGTTLLDDVTWCVDEGERWVILGPNGAGDL
jgi:iron complex transport system ATP-binding protein